MRPTTRHAYDVLFRRWPRQRAGVVESCLAGVKRLQSLDDHALRAQLHKLQWQSQTGAEIWALIPDVFAITSEAARRFAGQTPYVVQIEAGLALAQGRVAQMQTGEGKTLAAIAPALLHALRGKGAHVMTANDYLARRDADFAAAILQPLGIEIGCVTSEVLQDERAAHYARDITYGTSREMGFDFLRDRLARDADHEAASVQRGHYFALVDEADNVLLDDATTPLVISYTQDADEAATRATAEQFAWFATTARQLAPGEDFMQTQDKIELTWAGRSRGLAQPMPAACAALESGPLLEGITNALVAQRLLVRDRDYLVDAEGKVAIIDASTGRVAEGRRWREGLQQAIELNEGADLSLPTATVARCTVQSYFRRYRHLAGLTGTAVSAARELRRVYNLRVARIATHRPCQRVELPPQAFASLAASRQAIAQEVARRQQAGGAILVGTPSVVASEALSQAFNKVGIEHDVLNCRVHDREAAIIAQAGEPGRVTIATNMAGRGTDIRVHPDVLKQGGLHVIASQLHASSRIDRQLAGRAARQGEPGSFQQVASLEDEALGELGDAARPLAAGGGKGELGPSGRRWLRRMQRRLEARQARRRGALLDAEQARIDRCQKMGLDPLLEAVE